jgi:sulfatase maturation enzyme AslB (radical SAM superfamily)
VALLPSDFSAPVRRSSPREAAIRGFVLEKIAKGNHLAAERRSPVKRGPVTDEKVKKRNGIVHVFGPVPSRRLGRSLGVDLVPFKTCTYNCIYCQLGSTTHLTCEVGEYVPLRELRRELEVVFQEDVQADYVTLSGSGEPTLHWGIAEVIGMIKGLTPIPVAVLTNGSLLYRSRVRKQLLQADLIIPFFRVGRPTWVSVGNQANRQPNLCIRGGLPS